MAQWRKIIVSGSQAELAAVSASLGILVGNNQQITTSASTTYLSGSFSGSFTGDGSGLTGLAADLNFTGASGSGIVDLLTQALRITTGSASGINTVATGQTLTISGIDASDTVKGVASFNNTNFSVSLGSVSSNDITFIAGEGLNGGGNFTLGESVEFSFDSGSLLPYFSSSILGKVSGDILIDTGTGVATIQPDSVVLGTDTTGSYVATLGTGTGVTIGSNTGEGSKPTISVNYGSTANTAVQGNTTISISGITNEIEITGTTAQALGSGPSYTIGLPDNVNITQDLRVGGDLIVQGDFTYLNTSNLYVEDKFILLNSGSADPDEAGIIVDEGSGAGHAFVYDSATARWAFTSSLSSTATSVAPDAFAAAVVDLNTAPSADIPEYQKAGNIKIDTTGEIWIYA